MICIKEPHRYYSQWWCSHRIVHITSSHKTPRVLISRLLCSQVTQDGCSPALLLHPLSEQCLLQRNAKHNRDLPASLPQAPAGACSHHRGSELPHPLLVSLVTKELTWHQFPLAGILPLPTDLRSEGGYHILPAVRGAQSGVCLSRTLLQMCESVAQSCLTLCDPTAYTVHAILQAKILEWVTFSFARGSSQPRYRTQVSHIAGGFYTSWATRKPKNTGVGSLSLLQRIFPTEESNRSLPHCRRILYQPSYQGNFRCVSSPIL